MTTTAAVPETTTADQKAAETEPAPGYGDFGDGAANANAEEKPNEEENNEIDLSHTTESPPSEASATTFKFEKPSAPDNDEAGARLSGSSRIRTTKILEENSGRNMPETHQTAESLPWPWAKDILLEKPVMKKTSSN